MKNKVNILHLSDLHFGDESLTMAAKRKNVLERMVEIIKKEDRLWKPHLLVISGDIGWKGEKDDYQHAKKWLIQILDALELTSKELIICAGNHDIDLKEAQFLVSPSNSQDADNLLRVENIHRFSKPFENYISFCQEMGIVPYSIGTEYSFMVGSRKVEGLRFIILNSAWFCRKNKMNKLWIGLPHLQIMEASGQLGNKDMVNIALIHHPPEWLDEEENNSYGKRLNTYQYLTQYCSLVLSGHVHGAIKKSDLKCEQAFLFIGGSSYSGDCVRNNFSLFQVDIEKFIVKRRPFRFEPADWLWAYNKDYKVVIDFRKKAIINEEVVAEDDFYKLLLRGSKSYYSALTGIYGRFKYISISDIILTPPKSEMIETVIEEEGEEAKPQDILSALAMLWNKKCKHAVILGEGGMGKTVSLIRLWDEYTKSMDERKPVPVFISLNEYNRFRESSKRENFIITMIKENYLDPSVSGSDIWEAMNTPIQEEDEFIPSMILLLDGFNEITVDNRELLIELRELIEQARGIQIVVSSRFDMRANFNWDEFNLLTLPALENKQIESYLQMQGVHVPNSRSEEHISRLRYLIKNPMMLTLYTSTCEVQRNHQNDKNCTFKEKLETPGELLWNFMEAYVARLYERIDIEEEKKLFYKFLLKFLLPAIGYEMEKGGQFEYTYYELNNVLGKYCKQFYDNDFYATFLDYITEVENFREEFQLRVETERNKKIIKILSEELRLIVEERNSFRFLHQNFRDFFAAVHILNEIFISLKKKEIASVLKERTISLCVRRYLGEIEGEHYSKPFLVKGEFWKINENKDSLLYRTIDLCRGCFDRGVGFAVWNIIETWKEVREELSGADLSRLNLSKIILNSVKCSRFYKNNHLSAKFDGALLHERNIFPQGHSFPINSVVYSPDGEKILSASEDKKIKEWDVETGECLKTYHGHSHGIYKAVYSTDGHKILSTSYDEPIKEWDVESGKCLKTYQRYIGIVKNIIWNPISKKIFTALWEGTIEEWDLEAEICLRKYQKHFAGVSSIVQSSDGKKILSASHDRTIKEWDRKTGHCIKVYVGHTAPVISSVYSQDGQKILSSSTDKTIKEWDIHTGKCLKTYKGHSKPVNIALYSHNGKKILSASYDYTIKEWDVETRECLKTYKGHIDTINSILYSPDGKKIISASSDRRIKEWDIVTGECLKTYQGYLTAINMGIYRPDGKRILAACSDYTIKEWDVETGECLKIYKGHSDAVYSAIYSEDFKKILSSSVYGTIKEWDAETGECIKTYKGDYGVWSRPLYSQNGQKIFCTFYTNVEAKEQKVKELDVETGECLRTFLKENQETPKTQKIVKIKRERGKDSNKIEIKNADAEMLTIQNIPGLFIQKCSFKNLHPDSDLSEESKTLMKQYGAIF
ncbi:MAG: NACHT domain-containing protein [Candidatus Aminicenantes bacterium]|nr:NACHT domain-containing protein [Candidatus Aminicenantes bacterium]NIM79836.1 NACHT domain-containing protein [Candidatus Aminicenantes bacterium]NIN19167.1 NACHT domain-containing protein [Candidatus Aminicenantes bacterium]NIN43071.1 NACHT domain-containing protein [Candidatus Aminicenantes bacterium]NIN85812.1 NACHT domain-containing protein [Candidatus Aminicenantes bacterium]